MWFVLFSPAERYKLYWRTNFIQRVGTPQGTAWNRYFIFVTIHLGNRRHDFQNEGSKQKTTKTLAPKHFTLQHLQLQIVYLAEKQTLRNQGCCTHFLHRVRQTEATSTTRAASLNCWEGEISRTRTLRTGVCFVAGLVWFDNRYATRKFWCDNPQRLHCHCRLRTQNEPKPRLWRHGITGPEVTHCRTHWWRRTARTEFDECTVNGENILQTPQEKQNCRN